MFTHIYATVCVRVEMNDSKDMVYLLNLNELHMDHRTGLIILFETWLSVLHSQHLADIVNFASICTFFFQFSFSIFATVKTALDELLPIFLAAPLGKHADSLTLTNKTSTT